MKRSSCLLLLLLPVIAFAQSVAINTDNSQPDNSAILDIKSNSKGLLVPRLTTLERTSIMGPAFGLTVFDVTTASYWMYRGDLWGGWTELMHGYQKFWDGSGSNVFNTNAGNIGIGINNPTEKLCISSSDPSIQLLNSGSPKGFLQNSANDIRIGTYTNNTTGNLLLHTKGVDRMVITNAGLVGVGTTTPSSILTINAVNPVLQFRNAEVDKGFVQVANNDIRIGTSPANTTGKFIVRTNGADRLQVNEDGWVAIGTTLQNSFLQVNGDGSNAALRVQVNGSSKLIVAPNGGVSVGANQITPPDNGLYVSGNVGIGTAAPTSTVTINRVGAHPAIELKKDNVLLGTLASMTNAREDIALTAGDANGRVLLRANNNLWGVVVWPSLQVSVGNYLKATGYTLSVAGKIICEDLTMQNSASWPDYVFEEGYRLMPLTEVRDYIRSNKHLPNIPSAEAMEKDGIKVGDMSKRLMEKVEELTLYILQLQEQIDELKNERAKKNETNGKK